MITLPSDVLAESNDPTDVSEDAIGYAWDGKDGVNPNKETAMDWDEHQAIVFGARGLLGDGTFGAEIGKQNYISGDVRVAFKQLYAAYAKNGVSVVRVSKGIHQPTVDPHLQLRTSTQHDGGPVLHHKFHLNVSAEPVTGVDGLATGRFKWMPVQFAMKHVDKTLYKWPRIVTSSRKDKQTSLKLRRLSISTTDLQAHMDVMAEEKAAAEQVELEAKTAAAKKLKGNNFDAALEAFLDLHGGKSRHISATKGAFPSDNFKNGSSSARVQISGGVVNIKYDRVANVISKV